MNRICIFKNFLNSYPNIELTEAVKQYFSSTETLEHFKSIEHIEAYIFFLAETLVLAIDLLTLSLSIYITIKVTKYLYKNIKHLIKKIAFKYL